MSDENREPKSDSRPADEVIERRSLDAVLQTAQAIGELTGGLGALAIGASKLKETFGGGEQGAEAPSSDASAKPDEPKSGD
jgi:hypothetical protein